MDNFLDNIYILNLKERKDKWKLITKELENLNITNYERFNAIRPDTFENIPKSYYSNIKKILHKNKKYIIGSMGCKLSHYNIIKNAKKTGYKNILILEDDAVFENNFHITFNNIIRQINEFNLQWDMIYLGQNLREYDKVENIPNLVKIKKGFCTHGYLINSSFYDTILDNSLISGIEIDSFYNTLFTDHNCFCIKPFLINQRPGYSNIVNGYRNYITGRHF